MKLAVNYLVLFTAVISVCNGDCNFPPIWGAGHWMLEKLFPVNNTRSLITYKGNHAVLSSSNSPEIDTGRFTCDEFVTEGIHNYYIKKFINDPEANRRYCVDDIQSSNIMLHREVLYAGADDATIEQCKTSLESVDVYDTYLPVSPLTQVGGPTFEMPLTVDYPFDARPYRVTFTPPNGTELCTNDRNSVLVVGGPYISILTCKYKLYYLLPLTGLLQAKAVIDPTNLGEPDDSNGKIVILDWFSKSLPYNRTYCVRYKKEDTKVMLSFDLDSVETLRCRKGHRYDDGGTVAGRTYFSMTLHEDRNLVSKPPVPTTPRVTFRPTPGPSTSPGVSTIRPTRSDTHVQISLDIPYDDVASVRAQLASDVNGGMVDIMEISENRISDVNIIEGIDGRAVANFDLVDGIPSSKIAIAKLKDTVQPGFTAILRSNGHDPVVITSDSVYSWRDDDDCTSDKCMNGGKCMVMQGSYYCECPENFTGPYCVDAYVPSPPKGNNTIYIAIGVVAAVLLIAAAIGIFFFITRRNRAKDSHRDSDSESGYDNRAHVMSMEERDREIYSTINKQPKAFHEKSFSSLDKASDYGERTGIHL